MVHPIYCIKPERSCFATLVNHGDLLERLGFLSRLEWIVSLRRDRGLKELVNIDAADAELGKGRRVQMAEFGRRRGADVRVEREEAHKTWEKWADEIRAGNPEKKYSKIQIARILKKARGLKESIDTIRKRI